MVGLGGWFRVQGLGFRVPETVGFRVYGFRLLKLSRFESSASSGLLVPA